MVCLAGWQLMLGTTNPQTNHPLPSPLTPPCRSLWEALARCPQLGSRLSAQLDLARARFIEQQLMPALNRQGEDGW